MNRSAGIGWTPLHLAARDGHFDIVSLLLDNGADIAAKSAKVNRTVGRHDSAGAGRR